MRRLKPFHKKVKLMVWVRVEKMVHYIFFVLVTQDSEKNPDFGNR